MAVSALISFIIYAALALVSFIHSCVNFMQNEFIGSFIYFALTCAVIFLAAHRFAEWRKILKLQKENNQ